MTELNETRSDRKPVQKSGRLILFKAQMCMMVERCDADTGPTSDVYVHVCQRVLCL